jgi:NDP-sugar pyrophosphorylase family protein
LDAIIMAGGPGTRLDPYTRSVPKPLLPLDGTPILEIILRQLAAAGFVHVTLALSYLAEQIRAHVGDGSWLGLDVEYSVSDQRLGTAGPLGLIEPAGDPCLVCNADLLTTLDFAAVAGHHRTRRTAATMVVCRLGVDIPFGVAEVSDGRLLRYREKPTHEVLVGTGICVLEPEIWAHLTPGEPLDMPTLLERAMSAGQAVSTFVHDGTWVDIGTSPDSYLRAEELVRLNRDLFVPPGRACEAVA